MSATQSGAIVDKLLTQASQAYIPKGYISEKVLPRLTHAQFSGKLAKYGKSHLRIEHDRMMGKGKARRVTPIERSQTTFEIEDHGLEGLITERDFRNVERPYDARRDETLGLTTMVWLNKEKALADALTDTATIGSNKTLSGTSQLSDFSNSDPIGEFKTARETVHDNVGEAPNTVITSWDVVNTIAYHPGILDALGFTQNRAGQLSEQELAKALGVERLLVGDVSHNSANEGQSASLSSVWGKHMVFACIPERAMPYQNSLGYYVTLSGKSPRQVFRYEPKNPPNSEAIIVQDQYDFLLSDTTCAYLIKDAVA